MWAAILLSLLLWIQPRVSAQPDSSSDPNLQHAEQLLTAEKWSEVVRVAESVLARSAELEFCYGTALAHLERWDEARRAFEAGAQQRPRDKRFVEELAGVDFKQKNYAGAKTNLWRALRLDPQDSYANDFLGTIYFLEGNTDSALKYWNRIGRPQVASMKLDPEPRVDPVLLDRAFAFSPASTLELPAFRTTQARVDGLGIFPVARFDLQARDDGTFDVLIHNWERDGWGSNKWQALFGAFRGLPFQTVYPEFYNLGHQAINVVSLFRWDAEKRRALATISGPLQQNPKWRYGITVDLREENWNVISSFTGPSEFLGGLNLRREAIGARITSITSGRWMWWADAEVSHRDFRSVVPGAALSTSLLEKGYQLKQTSQANLQLLQIPERHLMLAANGTYELGRLWSQSQNSFLKLEPALSLKWFPQTRGDDYEIRHQVRYAKTFGDVPFDELFMLGVERDNDLWMRAHVGTRDGRKGSAPLGRTYFLSNWEMDKNIYGNGILNVKIGPFLDTGKISDPVNGLGSHEWLWDTGLQAKFRVLGFGVGFSYGRDLRSGNNAFYVTMQQ
jgi:hypothetical protein